MADETTEQRRARILALSPEDRAFLAGIIRRQLDRIPDQIAKLREDEQALTEWLTEFAPEMLPVLSCINAGISCQSSPDCPEYAQNKACRQGPPAYAPYPTGEADRG
ncbi:hypothetical protein Q0Z83_060550 [Actinoplanes sichuanensis]|uniref:Uncharacterized protein n=1 Tax=Actinoplanes sichuanensis TaxID=512349 RepID=A0ABW4A7L1_9ACTN|nr:hypothetical protein [Actinoplanes sichuanensis]BEL07864.1 hypothetical protein Q0Z83_060550 [Actinoplanes sichuanensis]